MQGKHIFFALAFVVFGGFVSTFAQDGQSTNDTVAKMKVDLNLSDDQVAKITQILERSRMASTDLHKSVDDGTINTSAVDSQRQQIEAEQEQEISRYLRSDQMVKWNQIQAQASQGVTSGEDNPNADTYSNLPKNPTH